MASRHCSSSTRSILSFRPTATTTRWGGRRVMQRNWAVFVHAPQLVHTIPLSSSHFRPTNEPDHLPGCQRHAGVKVVRQALRSSVHCQRRRRRKSAVCLCALFSSCRSFLTPSPLAWSALSCRTRSTSWACPRTCRRGRASTSGNTALVCLDSTSAATARHGEPCAYTTFLFLFPPSGMLRLHNASVLEWQFLSSADASVLDTIPITK